MPSPFQKMRVKAVPPFLKAIGLNGDKEKKLLHLQRLILLFNPTSQEVPIILKKADSSHEWLLCGKCVAYMYIDGNKVDTYHNRVNQHYL